MFGYVGLKIIPFGKETYPSKPQFFGFQPVFLGKYTIKGFWPPNALEASAIVARGAQQVLIGWSHQGWVGMVGPWLFTWVSGW